MGPLQPFMRSLFHRWQLERRDPQAKEGKDVVRHMVRLVAWAPHINGWLINRVAALKVLHCLAFLRRRSDYQPVLAVRTSDAQDG